MWHDRSDMLKLKPPFDKFRLKEFAELLGAFLIDVDKAAREDERKKFVKLLDGVPRGQIRTPRGRGPFGGPVKTNGLGRGKGQKRDPHEIRRLERRFHVAVRQAPGSTVEYLGKQLDVPTKDLQLPIRHLVEAGKIRKKGKARAVKYFTSRQRG